MTGNPHHAGILAVGSIFEGKYRIVRELGRGGFGTVYLAHQEKMGRNVALKVLRASAEEMHLTAKERFLREVKIISRLRHPNTVTIHDFGEAPGGIVYMVLEYIEGQTVKEILKNRGAQPPRRALALVSQIARSLAEAHRHGIIHRDLKPANIMVTDLETESDFVKVLDFGIARLLRTDQRDLTSMGLPEGERELIGTPRYMSPEQVRGESLSPASDVYSVGLILYEMLVGQPAVQAETTLGLITQQISAEPLRLGGLSGLHPELSMLVRRATAKNIAQRFPDAETFADATEHVLLTLGGALPGSASAHQTGRFMAQGFSQSHQNMPAHQPSGQFQSVSGGYPSQPNPAPDARSYQEPGQLFDQQAHRHHTPRDQSGLQSTPGGASGVQHYTPGGQISQAHHPAMLEPMTNPSRATLDRQRQSSGVQQAVTPAALSLMNQTPASSTLRSMEELPADDLLLADDLPPPPSDTNAFALPAEPEASFDTPNARNPNTRAKRGADEEENRTGALVVGYLRITLFGILALAGLYFAFIMVGPVFGHFLSGTLKLAATVVLALAIPLLTALGENSKRERFEVVDKPFDRVVRVCVGSAIFGFGTGIICALAMSGAVTNDLRTFPNWFMTDGQRSTSVGKLNAQISDGLAQIVEDVTTKIGIYEGVTSAESSKPGLRRSGPPAPTRPSTRRTETKSSADDEADVDKSDEANQADELNEANQAAKPAPSDQAAPEKTGESGRPARPSEKSQERDDYIRW